MKSSIKNLQNINGLNSIKSYTGAVRKSGKPALPTTAILDLSMRRNERDRLRNELNRLKTRKEQIQERLEDVEKEMTKLLEQATQTAVELRGKSDERDTEHNPGKKEKTVLEY